MTGLKTYTQYLVSLSVYNPEGDGPPTVVVVMTDEGGEQSDEIGLLFATWATFTFGLLFGQLFAVWATFCRLGNILKPLGANFSPKNVPKKLVFEGFKIIGEQKTIANVIRNYF